MKDTLIKLNNNDSYYIIDSILYNNRNYLVGVKCDVESDNIDVDNYYIFEYKNINNTEVIDNVDDAVAGEVLKILLRKTD